MAETDPSMPRPSMPRKAKASSARTAKKQALRYLAPVIDAAGQAVAWRFNPGPHLRALGHKSAVLRAGTGRAMTLQEAQAYRDAVLSGTPAPAMPTPTDKAKGKAKTIEPATDPRATPEDARTLNALWFWYQRSNDWAEKRLATQRFYATMIKSSLEWAGFEPVAALDGDMLRTRFKVIGRQKGVSTANGYLRALQAVLAYGERIKWGSSPARGLRLDRPKGRTRCATPGEVAALIAAADAMSIETGAQIYAVMGDAIVAALWTLQSQQDLLACNLDAQRKLPKDPLDQKIAPFGRLDFSGAHARIKTGKDTQVMILAPLHHRLAIPRTGRSAGGHSGLLIPGPEGQPWKGDYFRHTYAKVRARAAKDVPSVIDLQFRDLRDTAITRAYNAGNSPEDIANVSTHGTAMTRELTNHYLVMHTKQADAAMLKYADWAKANGIAV